MATDPSSFSNIGQVTTSHVALDWTIDFAAKTISGTATLTCAVAEACKALILDSRDLAVSAATVNGDAVEHSVGEGSEALGQPLTVPIPEAHRAVGTALTVAVTYSTSTTATAAQWLTPAQTAGKEHPYLFTQCQAIHARSLVPCQDSPSQKITYEANVTIPAHLEAVMSAVRQGESAPKADAAGDATRSVQYKQGQGIPSYLIALAVGNLTSREIGPRSKVWSEPEMVEKGAYEFADTEDFVRIGEELLTPYPWGVYDILLLPPSFPYGGMENPCLTFVTPTLLAGDRSLADVICHEASHSWSGNLVTSKYWSHFWLNESFTMFIQRKIMSRILGEKFFDFDGAKGLKDLADDVAHFGADNPLTALVPVLDGIDPDDAFSSVPYEKGFNLLVYLEKEIVGSVEKMDGFLKAYVTKFAGQSITTDDFKGFFLEHFADVDTSAVDWDGWFNKPGMPLVANKYDTSLRDACDALADKWIATGGEGCTAEEFTAFTPHQRLAFLDQLLILTDADGVALAKDALERMDATLGLTSSGNTEVRFRWLMLCIKMGYEACLPTAKELLVSQGRMKFVRPLYRALFKADGIEGAKQLALDTFAENRNAYHPIAAKMVGADLGVKAE